MTSRVQIRTVLSGELAIHRAMGYVLGGLQVRSSEKVVRRESRACRPQLLEARDASVEFAFRRDGRQKGKMSGRFLADTQPEKAWMRMALSLDF